MRTILYTMLLCSIAHIAKAQCNATITPLGPTTFCAPGSVTLQASPGDIYKWYKDGIFVALLINDTITVTDGGSYVVVVDSAGCIDTSAALVVTVNTAPAQPGTISGDTILCLGATVTYTVAPVPGANSYQWKGGINTSWSSFGATIGVPTRTGMVGTSDNTVSPASSISVRAGNSCGFSPWSVLPVGVYKPATLGGFNTQPDISVNQVPICPGSPAPLYANWHPDQAQSYQGPMYYRWYRNGVLLTGTGQSIYITKGGNYTVQIYNPGCSVTDTKPVHQSAPIPSIVPVSPTACQDGVTTLTVSMDMDGYNGNSYGWVWLLNGGGLPNSSAKHTWVAEASGVYSVSVSGSKTTNTGTYTCAVSSPAVAVAVSGGNATPVSITQNGNQFIATPGFATYKWYKNNAPIVGATGATYTASTWGDYFVVATDGNGCQSKSNVVLSVADAVAGDEEWRIFPSPASAEVNVYAVLPVATGMAQLLITDVAGRVLTMHEAPIKDRKIEKAIALDGNMPPGLYFIRITAEGYHRVSSFTKN
ncbi:MAG: hypothetical protein JNL72_03740 [Flavipsychrobacter sp.]|nr:hypothetical protein [Flavipsychrobacter sp.]